MLATDIMRSLDATFCSPSGKSTSLSNIFRTPAPLSVHRPHSTTAARNCIDQHAYYCVSSHGLSYTTFSFSGLHISRDSVRVTVTNTGTRDGAEVVQLYISPDVQRCSIPRPQKELKGFAKVSLKAAESREVEIALDRFALSFWDEILNEWVCEEGEYGVLIGKSSADIVLQGTLSVEQTTTWSGL